PCGGGAQRAALGAIDAGWLVLSGSGNVAGLLCAYAALRLGKVGIVAPIVSSEGAIAAVLAVVAGEGISPGAGATLDVIACGILLSGVSRDADEVPGRSARAARFGLCNRRGARLRSKSLCDRPGRREPADRV